MDPDQGFREEWYKEPLERVGDTIEMPVPSSFNDITTDASLRNVMESSPASVLQKDVSEFVRLSKITCAQCSLLIFYW
jgi:hypothetical protein